MQTPSDPAGGAGRARRRYAALRLLATSRAKSSDSGVRARAERSHILSPGIDLAHELSDLEDPLLPGNRVKRGALADHQHHVAGGHQHELRKGLLDGGQEPAERLDAAADALHGDACVDQSPRRLERDQVLEAVPVVSTLGEGGGSDKVGLRPVLQLATGEPEDLRNIAGPIGAAAAIGQGTRHRSTPQNGPVRMDPRSGESVTSTPKTIEFVAVGVLWARPSVETRRRGPRCATSHGSGA